MLRQFGYASVQFPSAEAFANQNDFNSAVCVLLDINLGDGSGIELRHLKPVLPVAVENLVCQD
jgi:FixJ family two-component response regulator